MSTRPGADVDCVGVQQSAGSVYYPALQQVTGQRAVSREFQACCSRLLPLLKKENMDPTQLNNYRPVSNLPFLSKLLEKVISERLRQHLEKIDGIPKHQSANRSGHSTETALLKIINDLLLSADRGEATVLCLLDLSAAFDTVDHQLLLTRLQGRFGVVIYLAELCSPIAASTSRRGMLRSATTSNLVKPRCRLSTYGARAFSVAGPVCWNALPDYLKSPDLSFDRFRHGLILFLFCRY